MTSFLIPGRKDLRFHAERVTGLSVQKDGGFRLPTQALSLVMWGWSVDGDPTKGGSICVGKGKTLVVQKSQDSDPEPAPTPEPTPEPTSESVVVEAGDPEDALPEPDEPNGYYT